jgi:vacuolar-type H+-ATPase subunit C/Vma6
MKPASTTYLVTRLHGLHTHLITQRDIKILVKTKSLKEVSDGLLKTEYGAEIGKLPTKEVDAGTLEEIFLRILVNRYFFVIREAQGKIQDLLSRYCSRFEVENIKRVIRAKHGGETIKELNLIPLAREHTLVNFPALLNAKDVEEVVGLLRETSYRPLAEKLEVYRQARVTMTLEAALDNIYFSRVWETAKKVPGGKGVRDLIGTEMDLRNLLTVVSLKLRDLSPNLIEEALISSWFRLSEERLHSLIRARLEDAPSIITTQPYATAISEVLNLMRSGSPLSLETIFLRELYRDAFNALRTYFLDAGYVVAYLLLSECEAKNLVTITTGKQLGLSEEEISQNMFLP